MNCDVSDLLYLKERYAAAARCYQPRSIQTLLVAEAPPSNLDRYFYFTNVPRHDTLFLETMGCLFPRMKELYLASRRDPLLKEALLQRFMEEGFFLTHLSEVPLALSKAPMAARVPSLVKRMEKLIDRHTPVILIKTGVYDCCYPVLKSGGYKVSPERIPYPGSGQQLLFREAFLRAAGRR